MRYVLDFGSVNIGGAPVFSTFKRIDTFVAAAAPAIVEIADGEYYFDFELEAGVPGIVWKATLNGAELWDVIVFGQPQRQIVDFGAANAGGAPAFTTYKRLDTFAAVTAPAVVEIGDGLYYFDPGWSSLAADVLIIAWKLLLNGVELSDVVVRGESYPSTLAVVPGALSLGDLRVRVRDAVLERATDRGLIPGDTSLDRYINAANRVVYQEALKANPRPWMERSADLIYGTPLSFTNIAAGGAPVRQVHLVRSKTGAGYSPVQPLEDGGLDFADIEEATTAPVVASMALCRWYVEGQGLWLTPTPTAAPTLRVSFVRTIGHMADPSAHYALAGQMPDHHDVVVWKAAQLLYRKDENLRTPWDQDVEEGLRALRRALARNQGQRTRRIRRAGHFPNVRRR